ncbi:phage tail protein [Enterobacter cloacae]|uniref:phage tail protein n=1 Tax=Enterobacter cloacae TaxID=550 RepID=UPI0028FB57D0|nr:phage tail protein [Enterobacter cloacae]MDT9875893.1 phage tail protein [Enterobacter cloacae]
MATKYLALLTNIGAAKLAKATALGTKVEITQMAVGDGNGVLPTPNPAQTALVHELRRAPLNMLTVDPANASQIIAEQVIPEDVGGWWIREIGLFDKDGDMVAIANCAETYKPQLQEGSGRVQVIRVILIVSSTEAVTLKIDPAVVLATRQYVDSQLRAHEQSRNHPDASTTEKGFVQLSSSVTSDSESQAATPKAVKIAMDNGSARLAKDRNLSDLPNTALARQNLELGDSSTRNVGTTAGTVASGDDARITGAMQKSQNGGDIPDVAKFLQNLGLNLFVQLSNQTRMDSPGKTYSLAVMDNDWGVWLSGTGTRVPLSMEAGGTGSGTPAGARQALGLKGAAVLDVGKVAGSVAAGDDSRITGAMQKSALGSDIPDKGSFQNNLGLSFNGTINSFTSKGPGLLIKQGGKVTAPNGTGNSLVIDFPIAFPNGCVDAFAIFEDGVPNQTPFEISIVPENTKMTVYILSTGGTIYFNNRSLRWSAEGF